MVFWYCLVGRALYNAWPLQLLAQTSKTFLFFWIATPTIYGIPYRCEWLVPRVRRDRPVKSHSNCSILPAAIRITYRVEKKSYRFPIPGRRQPLWADSHGSFGIRVNVNCGKMETTQCTFFGIFAEGKF